MKIEGLDYNTQREKLVMPEYGREIQSMVDYAVALPTKEERQRCAGAIVAIMERMFPQTQDGTERRQKFWDHIAMMSGFALDIDYPYDISNIKKMATRPERVPYPSKRIPVRHYGRMMFDLFDKLKTMPDGQERDELIRLTANQMKRDLAQWSHGSADDKKVAADLEDFTDGTASLDLGQLTLEKVDATREPDRRQRKKK